MFLKKEVKLFNIITNQNGPKAIPKHILCDYNVNSIVQHVNQIKNEIIIRNVNVNVKIIISVKKIKNGILSHALVRIANI